MQDYLTKQYINVMIMLFSGWWVYAYCQEDMMLPFQAGCVLIFIFILRSGPDENKRIFLDRLPLPAVLAAAMGLGLLWRSLVPGSAYTGSLLPLLTAATQSATIIASVLIFLKPFSPENLFLLTLLAWLTVAVSTNVPFRGPLLFITGFFCMVSTSFVILQTMNRPKESRRLFTYYRDFIIYSALLILLTTGFTLALSRTIAIVDNSVMDFISDYLLPRGYTNFLTLAPDLTLESPGLSAVDKRPVLEVEVPPDFFRYNLVYLKLQVFKDYRNGTWQEVRRRDLAPLPGGFTPFLPRGKLTMFTSLNDVIPSVARITAVKGKGTFRASRDNIIYASERQNSRLLEFSFYPKRPAVSLSDRELEQYTALPKDIAPALTRIANSIAGNETDDRTVAWLIKNFFLHNFKYTLDVDFKADNRGIIKMLRERRPAYCSYFATASALLLRARGIPARVVTGFMTSEKTDPGKNIYLARVKNAHAWTEALWPETDRNTGEVKMTWHLIDATPAGAALPQEKHRWSAQEKFERFLETSWLSFLRFRARLLTLDREQLKTLALVVLLATLAAINLARILRRLYRSRRSLRGRASAPSPELLSVLAVYKRYEDHLKKAFGVLRLDPETDQDVLGRLSGRDDIPVPSLEQIKEFLRSYHAVRFGRRTGIDLEQTISSVEKISVKNNGKK